jgi:hypothetical protein
VAHIGEVYPLCWTDVCQVVVENRLVRGLSAGGEIGILANITCSEEGIEVIRKRLLSGRDPAAIAEART